MFAWQLDYRDKRWSSYSSQLALKEHDEKQLYLARQHLFDIRNVYAVSTDIIQKNIVKVCKKTILSA